MKREERIEAVAVAWASLDGKLDDFRAGKTALNIEDFGGHYAGYMSDAQELISRIAKRGFVLVPREPTKEMVEAGYEAEYAAEPAVSDVPSRGEIIYCTMLQAYEQSKSNPDAQA